VPNKERERYHPAPVMSPSQTANSTDGAIDELIAQLELEALDRDLYIATPTLGTGRLFGGLVAAMSVVAAGRTVEDDRHLHSLHAYFLRGGLHDVPIRFAVDRIRDGRSFVTRRVVALQGGEAIFNLSASFVRPEEGISHQDPGPEAPGPEGLPDWEELRVSQRGGIVWPHTRPIEVLTCDTAEFSQREGPLSATRRMWMRPRGALPDDSLLHAAALVYASDRTLLGTAVRPHEAELGQTQNASLDHSVWLHRIPRFDDWVLFATESPVAHSARALIHGAMYTQDGTRIASVTQEGLIRKARN
jgi:acyl-CoA thioesterase-2